MKRQRINLSEKKYWNSKIEKRTLPILESLASEFPDYVLPGDFLIENALGSKIDDLIELEEKTDLLKKSELIESELYWVDYIDGNGKEGKKQLEKYRITKEGLDLLNSLRSKKINETLSFLTVILIIFGFIQIMLMIWQIILQYKF